MSGFAKFAAEFELTVNQTARVDIPLKVGEVTNIVTVDEKSVLVEAETSSLGQTAVVRTWQRSPPDGATPHARKAESRLFVDEEFHLYRTLAPSSAPRLLTR